MYTTKINHMNLNQIANSGQCFRWQQINDNTYKIPAFGKELTILQDRDLFTLSCDESEWNELWKKYFDVDTDTDYDEVEEIIKYLDDDYLKTAYEFGSGIRILRQDLWEVIVSFIISQNNNIPRIKKSVERLCDETGGKFPRYKEILDMDLSNKGLGYRSKYLENAVSWWIWEDGRVESKLRNAKEPKKYLLEVKGIGNKVADCVCLFALHHLNSFPIDTHIQKIIDNIMVRCLHGLILSMPGCSSNIYSTINSIISNFVQYIEQKHAYLYIILHKINHEIGLSFAF